MTSCFSEDDYVILSSFFIEIAFLSDFNLILQGGQKYSFFLFVKNFGKRFFFQTKLT